MVPQRGGRGAAAGVVGDGAWGLAGLCEALLLRECPEWGMEGQVAPAASLRGSAGNVRSLRASGSTERRP
eukprot:2796999-Heterocapsa_arctica.AAC.1